MVIFLNLFGLFKMLRRSPDTRFLDWTQKGCSYETTVFPTYVSFLTTYLGA